MIVKCERCQTRFKIPDEKVTDKGVKVRCTKCQHTFRVAREDVSSTAPAPAVPSPDPAVKPPATPRAGTPLEVPRASPPSGKPARPVGLDNLFDGPVSAASTPGIASPRGGAPAVVPRVSSLEAPKTPATIDLDPLMEFMGENTPTPAEALKLAAKAPIPNKPAGALATGPVQPPRPAAPAPKPAQAAAPVPVQVPTKSPVPVQVPAKSPALAPVSSAPFSFDENNPFGSTDTEATLPAPVPTLPPAPKPVPMTVPTRSAPPAPKPAQAAAPVPVQVPARSPAPAPRKTAPVAFEENDPFSLPPDNAPTVPATPTLPPRGAARAPMAFEENDPFSLPPDNAPTVPATPTLPPRGAAPSPAYEEMDGLEGNNPFVSFQPQPPTPAPTPVRRPAPVPVPAADPNEMEGLEGNNPFATFDPVAALPPASAKGPAPVPAAAPNEMEGLEGNNPFATFDPVAALPPASAQPPAPASSPAPSGIPDWGAPQQGAPSGIPDWGAPQQGAPSGIPDWGATQTVPATPIAKAGAPTERNPFPDFPGPGEGAPGREVLADLPPAPPPPVIAAPPPKQETPRSESHGPSLVQRLAGVAAQLVVGAVLLVGLVAVAIAWLNGGRVELSALSPSRMRELVSPTRPLVAKDLSNGLYTTRDGRSLFFVRGEVENRGTSAIRVKAGVALYDGDNQVKSAEGLVGAVPTPEELHVIGSAGEADALRSRLDAAAKEVAPGARAPFIVFFYEYPEDLSGIRLEVTLEPQAAVASGGAKEGSAGNAQP
ncbi:zinc-ribbon domain-containing protein [Archangium lansingense]|uniref:Zinc-ribbon domain-containing protein n=1 Tax=Archangium lansingense TaxID=2995310 RepID=A0ABT4AIP8_9BACT|nr:zinc-ribbon domain-containing protein [Archangium lansinium]MCY1081186.1 zinc-ribbon domain-containing protein [Archangium lansinium]